MKKPSSNNPYAKNKQSFAVSHIYRKKTFHKMRNKMRKLSFSKNNLNDVNENSACVLPYHRIYSKKVLNNKNRFKTIGYRNEEQSQLSRAGIKRDDDTVVPNEYGANENIIMQDEYHQIKPFKQFKKIQQRIDADIPSPTNDKSVKKKKEQERKRQETQKDEVTQKFEKYNKQHEQPKGLKNRNVQKKINDSHKKREYAYNGGYIGDNQDKLWDYFEYAEKLPQMIEEAEKLLERQKLEQKMKELFEETNLNENIAQRPTVPTFQAKTNDLKTLNAERAIAQRPTVPTFQAKTNDLKTLNAKRAKNL